MPLAVEALAASASWAWRSITSEDTIFGSGQVRFHGLCCRLAVASAQRLVNAAVLDACLLMVRILEDIVKAAQLHVDVERAPGAKEKMVAQTAIRPSWKRWSSRLNCL